ncbi:MAG: GNAT family N-acetyltransferase [Proteobacteria bacterium]|nr:GNAT family N-acetyltransferase [Pseudomonadota bacterium]
MHCRIELDGWMMQEAGARRVRTLVFLEEQQVPPDMEWDEFDAVSLHALARAENGAVIGTGRLLPDGHIGRMAVLKAARGKGVGSVILQALMQAARERGDAEVALHAQLQAEHFYARFGFVREGEEFMEAGIPHILMRHALA